MPLESVEQISSNSNKYRFLREYMKHHAVWVPFQNIELAAVDFEKRKNPSVDDIVEQGLTGNGGCCIQLNYFTMLVFQALGFDAYAIQGTHFGGPVTGTHCMVVVRLSDDEVYLVEVGGAFPILEPINMCKLPVRIVSAGGFPYEFREVTSAIIGKYHVTGGLLAGAFTDKEEILRTSWDLKPRDFSEFDYPMMATFTIPKLSVLLRNPLMCRYFAEDEIRKLHPELFINECNGTLKDNEGQNVINNGNNSFDTIPSHFIFMYKRIAVIGNSEERKVVKQYSSYADMGADIEMYFPTLNLKDINKAMDMFDMHVVSETPYDKIL